MTDPEIIIGISTISCGILFVAISIPLVAKKIPMNHFYGFRISKAFESEENWYEINRYGGKQFLRWSVLLVAIGVLYFTFPIDNTRSELTNTLMAVLPIIICPTVAIIKTLLFSRQL